MLNKLQQLNLTNLKVIVRVDLNLPIVNQKITSTKRIEAILPTIKYLVKAKSKIILMSHFGRINSLQDKQKYSLKIVAQALSQKLQKPIQFVNQTRGTILEKAINSLLPGQILMLENTRFEDWVNGKLVSYESKNDSKLAQYWANLGDVFVNDAFATIHRVHASNVGIAKYIKKATFGFLLEHELKMLDQGLKQPKLPLIAIIGGAKVSDKINVIKHLAPKVTKLLIGGGMAYTFLKALNFEIGKSLVENDYLVLAKQLLKTYPNKIVLPIDFKFAYQFVDQKPWVSSGCDLPPEAMGMDIGPKTIKLFQQHLIPARTIIWNGPMGVFEFKHFAKGTKAICQIIAKLKNVFSIIGGGDSASASISLGFGNKFSHISTGGGATLAYMEGKKLLALETIKAK